MGKKILYEKFCSPQMIVKVFISTPHHANSQIEFGLKLFKAELQVKSLGNITLILKLSEAYKRFKLIYFSIHKFSEFLLFLFI